MATVYDLKNLNLTRRMFGDPVFTGNLLYSLKDASIKALLASNFEKSEKIVRYTKELEILSTGNADQKKQANDKFLGEWSLLLNIIYQSPTPVASPPSPQNCPCI